MAGMGSVSSVGLPRYLGYNPGMELEQLLQEIEAKKRHTKNKVVVSQLDESIVHFLEERGVVVYTREIYINHKGLSHLARESKRKRGAGLSEEDILTAFAPNPPPSSSPYPQETEVLSSSSQSS